MENLKTLGEILREKLAKEAYSAALKLKRASDDSAAAQERNSVSIKSFFDAAKLTFETQIRKGGNPVGIKVGANYKDTVADVLRIRQRLQVLSPDHEYHSFYADFAKWADDSGLVASWEYVDDDISDRPWYLLNVALAQM